MKAIRLALGGLLVTCGGQTLSSGQTSESPGTPNGSGGLVSPSTGGGGAPTTSGGARTTSGGTSTGDSPGIGGTVTPNGGAGTASGGVSASSGGSIAGGSSSSGGAMGTGGRVDAGSDGSRPVPTSTCKFTFAVTTVTYNGNFSPHNVGAIWIEDSSKAFVKTLRLWAGPRASLAFEWVSVSGANKVDAITSATRASEGPIDGSWNCTDVSETLVPYGTYFACVEIEEDSTLPFLGPPPHYTCQEFEYTGAPASGVWPDQPNFVSMSWSLQ